jgi:hypothetical protein
MNLIRKRRGRSANEPADAAYWWAVKMQKFLAEVRSVVEPLLFELGFQLEEFSDIDYHGRTNGSLKPLRLAPIGAGVLHGGAANAPPPVSPHSRH